MTDANSGSDLVRRVAQGTESATEEVYRRYRRGLVAFVQRKLGSGDGRVSAEDVAASAWGSFLRGVAEQRYKFDHAGALWRLLSTIAWHKLSDAIRNERFSGAELEQDLLIGRDPTPSEAAAVVDTIQELLEGLPPSYGDVLQLLLEGHTVAEIARRLNSGRQPVRTMVKHLEERLERLNKQGNRD